MHKKMRVFLLEDEVYSFPRNAILEVLTGHDLTVATSVPEAKRLWNPPYDLVLLDHDMEGHYESSDHPNTGFAFVAWLMIEGTINPARMGKTSVILHSQNPRGKLKMFEVLRAFGWRDIRDFHFGTRYIGYLTTHYGLGTTTP